MFGKSLGSDFLRGVKVAHNKEKSIKLFFLLAIALYFSACSLGTIGQQSSRPIVKSGVISSDEVWSGRIIIKGDVTVSKGVTLTIQPGTIVGFDADAGSYKLTINGTLYAEGNSNQRITFASLAVEPKPEDWIGLVFGKSGLNSRLKFCRLMHYREMTCYSDSLKITDCIFSHCKTAILCEGSSPSIENNEFSNNKIAIKCLNDSESEIRRNLIQVNQKGIVCDNANPSITRNQIEHNYQHAIICYSASSPEIRSNNIVRNDGWAVYNGGKLSNNFIKGNNKEKPNAIDTGTGRSSSQYYGVDEVSEVQKSPTEAGPRKMSKF